MIDIETVAGEEEEAPSRFRQATLGVVGLVAVLAAVLATVQLDASQRESRALAMASRLSVDVSAGTTASMIVATLPLESVQQALSLGVESTSRSIGALEDEALGPLEEIRAAPDAAASERLLAIAGELGEAPEPGGPLDAYAAGLLTARVDDLFALSEDQNAQITIAEAYGARSARGVLGLSLLALAGVLAGLASVMGAGRAGSASLAVAAVVTALAAAAGLSAVL